VAEIDLASMSAAAAQLDRLTYQQHISYGGYTYGDGQFQKFACI